MDKINFTIMCIPTTKKNSSRIIVAGGRPRIIPSKKYIEYENACKWFLKPLGINYPINIKCIFYMPTRRRVDLTNLLSAIDDVLVKHGVIIDDNRDIIAAHDGSRVFYSKENPRTEIEITKIKDYEKWGK